jgi:hypothetical protein
MEKGTTSFETPFAAAVNAIIDSHKGTTRSDLPLPLCHFN